MDVDAFVQRDSIVTIPKGISDSDAISTAVAVLCGVHCSLPLSLPSSSSSNDNNSTTGNNNNNNNNNNKFKGKKAVVLGGGDYACFIAKALDVLGAQVSLVTTRPMSLKDTPLNPLRGTNGE